MQFSLPYNPQLSIPKLTSVFRNTSATYKFYWFWSIQELVEEGKKDIEKKEIFAKMLTLPWYTVNYFHVSFGKQDKIQEAILSIKDIESLNVDDTHHKVFNKLLSSKNQQTKNWLTHFDINVPHKFLSPWLGALNKNEMYAKSEDNKFDTPYSIFKNSIVLRENWFEYFKINSGILKTFCYWNLALFLQCRNPNVPDIPNKIHRPILRSSLNNHKNKYWDLVLDELGKIDCIYSGKELIKGNYVIEHFVPYQFVAHDLMWNLIPADSAFNSKKSDKLPQMNVYFESFYETQMKGYEIMNDLYPKNSYLEDFLPLFPDLKMNKTKYKEYLKPLLSIANNNGFRYM